jgi:hypothetical protein
MVENFLTNHKALSSTSPCHTEKSPLDHSGNKKKAPCKRFKGRITRVLTLLISCWVVKMSFTPSQMGPSCQKVSLDFLVIFFFQLSFFTQRRGLSPEPNACFAGAWPMS